MESLAKPTRWVDHLLPVVVGAVLLAGLYGARVYNYILFHSIAEIFSIVVG